MLQTWKTAIALLTKFQHFILIDPLFVDTKVSNSAKLLLVTVDDSFNEYTFIRQKDMWSVSCISFILFSVNCIYIALLWGMNWIDHYFNFVNHVKQKKNEKEKKSEVMIQEISTSRLGRQVYKYLGNIKQLTQTFWLKYCRETISDRR